MIESTQSRPLAEEIQKSRYPQYLHAAAFEGVMQPFTILGKKIGMIAHESAIKIPIPVNTPNNGITKTDKHQSTSYIQQEKRPIALRSIRKELAQQAGKAKNRSEREEIIRQGHERDRIAHELLNNQQEVIVDDSEEMKQYEERVQERVTEKVNEIASGLEIEITDTMLNNFRIQATNIVREELLQEMRQSGEIPTKLTEEEVKMGLLGKNMARFAVLTPPRTTETSNDHSQRPIIVIGGVSSDIEEDGILPQALAFRLGRPLLKIAYPDSWRGNVTDKFGEAAERSSDYQPYTTFFQRAIEIILQREDVQRVIGEGKEFDIWSYSTGAAITAELLTKSSIQQKVVDAVLIAPPSCVDQRNITIGNIEIPIPGPIIREYLSNILHLPIYAKKNVANFETIEWTPDHRRRELRAYKALRKKVLRKNGWWKKNLQTKEGGHIVVVSGSKDEITKSAQVIPEIRQNPRIFVVEMLDATHTTPILKPEEVVEKVNKLLVA